MCRFSHDVAAVAAELEVALAADGGEPVVPSTDTIRAKTYAPLSRPLFIYVRNDVLKTPTGSAFVEFYLDKAAELAGEVGYVAVSDDVAANNLTSFEKVAK